MNTFTYDQLTVGQTESFQTVVTADMLDKFMEISGDISPLHCDENFARQQGYPGRVVYGMLTASFYSKLAGVYLPGKYCLLQEITTKFRSPVFIGDLLTITGTISEKNDTCKRITIKAEIVNEKGKKVSKAIIQIGVDK